MALAKKCDICGKYYDPYEIEICEKLVNGFTWTWTDSDELFFCPIKKALDCCPECMAKIRDFIAELKKKEKSDES